MTMTLSKRQSRIIDIETNTTDFEVLFKEYWKRLCGILCQILGDPQEAEDLAMETFIRLYRCPPSEDYNLGGWLYRVATNLGLNALRARNRRQRYEERALSFAIENSSPEDPAEAVERSMKLDRVRVTLGSMKPRSAKLLILRHSGLSYSEIASAVGVSPGSVGTLLGRAQKEFERTFESNERRG